MLVDLLTADSTTTAKLVYAPFNPTLPPPLLARPNFSVHLQQLLHVAPPGETKEEQIMRGMKNLRKPVLAQCSLSALAEDLAALSYKLLHVDHHFAVFVHGALAPVFGLEVSGTAHIFDEWRSGWFCSPLSRYFSGLEQMAQFSLDEFLVDPTSSGASDRAVCKFFLRQNISSSEMRAVHGCNEQAKEHKNEELQETAAQQARRVFWSRELRRPVPGLPHLLAREFRATCHEASGICDCLVPFRGPICAIKDMAEVEQTREYRGAIHYIVGEDEEHVQEMLHALQSLWDAFNSWAHYPVLVFHDGLSDETRERIVLQAPHRLWFFRVHDWLPQDANSGTSQEAHHHHFMGYRAQSRFRAGPLFAHPGARAFDYLLGLDTDSHFPAAFGRDPFVQMHENSELVIGYHYMTKTSPPSAMHFWDYTMLYAMERGIDVRAAAPSRKHFMSNFTVSIQGYENSIQWNSKVLMTDCELLRVSFFREGSRYFDYYSFLDSVQGFWRYRWGDHAVRGVGVGLALWEEDRSTWMDGSIGRGSAKWPRTFELDFPYGHQNYCHCGAEEHCLLVHDPKAGLLAEQELIRPLHRKIWRCAPGLLRAKGEASDREKADL